MNLKWVVLVLIFSILSPCGAWADSSDNPFDRFESNLNLGIEADLYEDASAGDTIGYYVSATERYYLTSFFGFFGGLSLVTRTLKPLGVASSSAYFIDIPYGITFRYKPLLPIGLTHLGLGGYTSIPLSDFNFTGATFTTKSVLGLYVQVLGVYSITDKIGVNADITLKLPLSETLENSTNSKYLAISLGTGLTVIF